MTSNSYPNTHIYLGSFRIAPHDQPDYIRIGANSYQVKCKTVSVSGDAHARRKQVRKWQRQGLRVTPAHLHWTKCVVQEQQVERK